MTTEERIKYFVKGFSCAYQGKDIVELVCRAIYREFGVSMAFEKVSALLNSLVVVRVAE